jgi:hypothetical protein
MQKDGFRPGEPQYDPRTLYIPKKSWLDFTPFEKQVCLNKCIYAHFGGLTSPTSSLVLGGRGFLVLETLQLISSFHRSSKIISILLRHLLNLPKIG